MEKNNKAVEEKKVTETKMTNEDYNKGIEAIERRKEGNVTMKTLKSWLEQSERIRNDEQLIDKQSAEELRIVMERVKGNFIANKF